MTNDEYTLYILCEEFHYEIRRNLQVSNTAAQNARRVLTRLTRPDIERILNDVELIRGRGGYVGTYFCTVIAPLVTSTGESPDYS
jgi:hypothetical protein